MIQPPSLRLPPSISTSRGYLTTPLLRKGRSASLTAFTGTLAVGLRVLLGRIFVSFLNLFSGYSPDVDGAGYRPCWSPLALRSSGHQVEYTTVARHRANATGIKLKHYPVRRQSTDGFAVKSAILAAQMLIWSPLSLNLTPLRFGIAVLCPKTRSRCK